MKPRCLQLWFLTIFLLLQDMCVCQFFLWKCGMEKCPDFMKEDFVSEKCLCLHEECGFSDMVKDCQLCCFKLTC